MLRQATAGIVPDQVRWRRRKLGFAAPERQWAQELWRSSWRDLLSESGGTYVSDRQLRAHAQRPGSGAVSPFMLWRLTELTLWEQRLKSIAPFPTSQAKPELCSVGAA